MDFIFLSLLAVAGAYTSCSEIASVNPGAASGDYVITTLDGDVTVACDMDSQDGGWTLVYKITDFINLKTESMSGQENLAGSNALLETGGVAGKLSDNAIREICTGQYKVMQMGSSVPEIFCKFDDINSYADGAAYTGKDCQASYDSNGDNYPDVSWSGYWSHGFSTWGGITGSVILNLNYGDSRVGSHIAHGVSTSDPSCSGSGGCHSNVYCMTEDIGQWVNVCTCSNGQERVNDACTVTGAEQCASCNSGYELTGDTCSDIDECSTGAHNCDSAATCSNTDGSFTCTCNAGYIGGGTSCTACDNTFEYQDDAGQAACKFCSAGHYGMPGGAQPHTQCDDSLCQHPAVASPVMLDADNCPSDGVLGSDECHLTCEYGYEASNAVPHTCEPQDCADDDVTANTLLQGFGLAGDCATAVQTLPGIGYDCTSSLAAVGLSGTVAELCPISCGYCAEILAAYAGGSITCTTLDADGDGVFDADDAFPNDPTESVDSDGDGVGDNADAFPNDAQETVDSDGDGVGDNADAFPDDATEDTDTDGDGVGDNADDFPDDPDRSASALTWASDQSGLSAGVVILILIVIGLVIAALLVWFFVLRKKGSTEVVEGTGEEA